MNDDSCHHLFPKHIAFSYPTLETEERAYINRIHKGHLLGENTLEKRFGKVLFGVRSPTQYIVC